ncbi:hypothetical protein LMG29542_07658 [Paraburkholderia humisilvae]|uniref:Integrase catalytic domain-containing protein n=1 Tax=Paraburkholderia humisilvae TaxID=627669 RepID=A0A6J5FAK6_9BURK|nr:hypothetical protein LMG29542_07658 [Paraburkholderia humisilvae]
MPGAHTPVETTSLPACRRHLGRIKPLALGKNHPQDTRILVGNRNEGLSVPHPPGQSDDPAGQTILPPPVSSHRHPGALEQLPHGGQPCCCRSHTDLVTRPSRSFPPLLFCLGASPRRASSVRHDDKMARQKSNRRWCFDGFEFRYDDGKPLRVTFALDCCDREAMNWVTMASRHSGNVMRDVMLAAAVKQRFGNVLKAPCEN